MGCYDDSAMETYRAWRAVCVAQSGSENRYKADTGIEYVFMVSRNQGDDAITGKVMKVITGSRLENGTCQAVNAGSFRIEANGTVTKYPAGLKALLAA